VSECAFYVSRRIENRTVLKRLWYISVYPYFLPALSDYFECGCQRSTQNDDSPSSGETTVFLRHLILVILYGWLSGMQGMHTRQSST